MNTPDLIRLDTPTGSTPKQSVRDTPFVPSESSNGFANHFEGPVISHLLSKSSRYSDEGEHDSANWLRHKCHVILYTFSGKPVYSRYGNEESIVGFTGTLQALQSKFVSLFDQAPDSEDSLRSIEYGDVRLVFFDRSPLVAVALCKGSRSQTSLGSVSRILQMAYHQLLFVLTEGVNRTLEARPNFDVRSLLGGTKPLFSNLISHMNNSLLRCVQDAAVEVLPLPFGIRSSVTRAMQEQLPQVAQWAGLLAGSKLVATAGHESSRSNILSAGDLVLLMNIVVSSASLRMGESWTPVCLPSLSAEAFVHAYVQYIDQELAYVCLSISGDNLDFYAIAAHCKNVKEALSFGPEIDAIQQANSSFPLSFADYVAATPIVSDDDSVSMAKQQILMHVRHAGIVLNNSRQLFSSRVEDGNAKDIFKRYVQCVEVLGNGAMTSQSQQVCLKTKSDFVFAWLTSEFQLFITAPRDIDIAVITYVYQWVRQNEQTLFIPNLPNSGDSGTRLNTRTNPLW